MDTLASIAVPLFDNLKQIQFSSHGRLLTRDRALRCPECHSDLADRQPLATLFPWGSASNTAIFSVVNAVLLKQLPYPHRERITMIWDRPYHG